MTIAKALIQYGFTEADKYTHIKWFSTGDSSNKVGTSGSVANLHSNVSGLMDINHVASYIQIYLRALEEICQPGVKVLATSAEQYSDNNVFSLRQILYSANYDFPDFTPNPANLPKAGPRGRAFVGGKQAIPSTKRYGWLRFHYIAGNFMDLPTIFVPSAVNADFATYYNRLRVFGGSVSGYRTLTSALQTYITDETMDIPSGALHMGVRNG